MKQQLKSKTIIFMAVMAGITTALNELSSLGNILTPDQLTQANYWLTIATTVGGVLLRQVTTAPLSEK